MRCQREDCIRTGECWCHKPLLDAPPEPQPVERFCLVEDSEGHHWLCPVERRREVVQQIEAIVACYESGDYDGASSLADPEHLGLKRIDNPKRFTFTNPQEDG